MLVTWEWDMLSTVCGNLSMKHSFSLVLCNWGMGYVKYCMWKFKYKALVLIKKNQPVTFSTYYHIFKIIYVKQVFFNEHQEFFTSIKNLGNIIKAGIVH
jgi:hypothetical protein